MTLRNYFGDKTFYKRIISICLPIMAQQFISSFVNLIDNIMVGGISQTALTAVTVTNQFYMVFSSLLFGICGAASIFLAQNYGAGQFAICQKVFNISLTCCTAVALLFSGFLLVAPMFTIRLFTDTPELVELGYDYLKIARFTYLPYGFTLAIAMALRAVGINTVQLKVGTAAVLTNTILNYILIYGKLGFPAMGVKGAAIATLIARLLELIWYAIILVRHRSFFKLDIPGMLHLDFTLIKKMLTKAIPLTVNEILYSLGWVLIFKAYMRTDEVMVAAISVANTVSNLAFIVFGGLSSAVSILVGSKLGAGLLEEARADVKRIITFGVMVGLCSGALLFLIARLIPGFYSLDVRVAEGLVILLRFKAFMIPIYVYNVCGFFTLRAGGDTTSTVIMDSGFLWLCPVLISTLLSLLTDIQLIPLYILVEAMDVVKLFAVTFFLKRGKWVRNMAEMAGDGSPAEALEGAAAPALAPDPGDPTA